MMHAMQGLCMRAGTQRASCAPSVSAFLPALFCSRHIPDRRTSTSLRAGVVGTDGHPLQVGEQVDTPSDADADRAKSHAEASTSGEDQLSNVQQAYAKRFGENKAVDPGLYLVGTPIGNLEDISFRALRVLRSATLVLAEDTRHSRKLLSHYGINASMLSFHEHNEKQRLQGVTRRLESNEVVALISDAGMPGISDPGAPLVAAAIQAGIKVVPIPGPCALVAGLVASGLDTTSFTFVGFLPPKTGARRARLRELAATPSTLVLYAPPHGLAATLADCVAELGPGRPCCVAREMTKLHEEFYRVTLGEALHEFTTVRQPKGEIVLLIGGAGTEHSREGASQDSETGIANKGAGIEQEIKLGQAAGGVGREELAELLHGLLEGGMSVSGAVKEVVTNLSVNKKVAYGLALEVSRRLPKGDD